MPSFKFAWIGCTDFCVRLFVRRPRLTMVVGVCRDADADWSIGITLPSYPVRLHLCQDVWTASTTNIMFLILVQYQLIDHRYLLLIKGWTLKYYEHTHVSPNLKFWPLRVSHTAYLMVEKKKKHHQCFSYVWCLLVNHFSCPLLCNKGDWLYSTSLQACVLWL
jgi:hypothetical protein